MDYVGQYYLKLIERIFSKEKQLYGETEAALRSNLDTILNNNRLKNITLKHN